MRAIDTNVVLRLVVADDPDQVSIASRLIREPVYISNGVLMETVWVLGSSYRQSRATIAAALGTLLDIATIHVADEDRLRWAIERYRDHRADFADMLHLIAAKDSSTFASFERKLEIRAGPATPVPIERPT